MKIAFVMMDGLEQFVLTPESETEKRLVDMLTKRGDDTELSIHRGSFYHCQGGWFRQGGSEDSAILCLRPAAAKDETLIEEPPHHHLNNVQLSY